MIQLDFKQKRQLVTLLLACPSVGKQERRQAVINELPADIKNSVVKSSVDRDEVLGLVNACLGYEGGLEELRQVVGFFEAGSKAWRAVDKFLKGLSKGSTFAEDGQPLESDDEPAPLEAFDARSFLPSLQAPGGAVRLRDKLYVRRQADDELQQAVVQWGTTTTIRAPRQTGKTSLLMRGLHHAKRSGAQAVFVDFQNFDHHQRSSATVLLRELATIICHQLGLDESKVQNAWQGTRGAQQKMTYFLEDKVLPAFEVPLVLAMDEVDSLLQTNFYRDFFGMVRSWHNLGSSPIHFEQWEKLNLVLVISTEPYLLIDDIRQSPFNVGQQLSIADFTAKQVSRLNQQHGAPVSEQELPLLHRLLGGHPYLTRQALYSLVIKGISWHDLAQNATSEQSPFGQHLKRYYWAIHDKPKLTRALLAVIRTNRCPDETTRLRLLKAGLIHDEDGVCTCRCELYKRYFERRLS